MDIYNTFQAVAIVQAKKQKKDMCAIKDLTYTSVYKQKLK